MKWIRRLLLRWLRSGSETPRRSRRERVEALLGVPVRRWELFEEALRHRSVAFGGRSYERLEYLGDAVLGLVVADFLFHRFPEADEGTLTRYRSQLVNGRNLARYAKALGLPDLLELGAQAEAAGARYNATVLADALEALIGAIFLDQGFEAARYFLWRLLREGDLERVLAQEDNYKSLLLEFAQARGWAPPFYRVEEERGPSHAREFTVSVWVEGRALGTGTGRSKKAAEQEAARQAWMMLTGKTP
jgi:ribonuclease-3|nr:MAG: ribonuclease 3 [Bacteroidota bacterium]